jgi:uncharacterized membrane protein
MNEQTQAKVSKGLDPIPEPTTPKDAASQEIEPSNSSDEGITSEAIIVTPAEAQEPLVPAMLTPPPPSQAPPVHVASNLLELVTAPDETKDAAKLVKEQHELNEVVHSVLIVGVALATALMLSGLGLDLFLNRELPTTVPDVSEVISRVLVLRPSGFFALGLLVLIATPILRVIGSILAFAYEQDWRFVFITVVVLMVVVVSMVIGRG